MRVLLFSLLALWAVGSTGCKKSSGVDPAVQRANFQKAQREKAIKIHEENAKKFPNSPYAAKAAERARILRAQAGPAKK